MRREQLEKLEKNQSFLLTCENHEFVEDNGSWKCKNCGGEVSDNERQWYELGKEHYKKAVEAETTNKSKKKQQLSTPPEPNPETTKEENATNV